MRDLNLPSGCVSDLVLDEWMTGELDAARGTQVESHLEHCPRCKDRRAVFAEAQRAFLDAAPSFDAHAAHVGRRARPGLRATRRWPWLGAALAASMIALLALWPATEPSTRSKGGPHIGFFVKRGDRVTSGQSGEAVRPGDRLRFTYSSDRARYLALFNRDRRGAAIYYPSGTQAAHVAAGSGVALDFSIELDDSLGPERIYAVFCPSPFELEPMRTALMRSSDLAAPAGCHIDIAEITKEARE
jgi:hypothetical protein